VDEDAERHGDDVYVVHSHRYADRVPPLPDDGDMHYTAVRDSARRRVQPDEQSDEHDGALMRTQGS